jgi:hypothetical protein
MFYINQIAHKSTIGKRVLSTGCSIYIDTLTEGQDIEGNVNIAFHLTCENIAITAPTEGQDIEGNVNISFNLG